MRYPARRNPETLRQSAIQKLHALAETLEDLESPIETALSEISETVLSLESLHAELLASMPLDYQGFLEFIRDDPAGQNTKIYENLKVYTEGRVPNAEDLAAMLAGKYNIDNKIKRLSDSIRHIVEDAYPNYDQDYLGYLLEQRTFLVKILNMFHPRGRPVEFSDIQPGDRYKPTTMSPVPSDVVSGNVEYVYAQGIPGLRLPAVVRVKQG